MARTVVVAGLAIIKVNTGDADALEELGITLDGAQITEQTFTYDVRTDEFGGDAGPPADQQYMGEIHQIRLLMTKWDTAVGNKVGPLKGGTAGTPGAPGTLMFANAYRLLIHSPNFPRNYHRVLFKEPRELNKGTKHTQWLLVGTAYEADNGIMHDGVTV